MEAKSVFVEREGAEWHTNWDVDWFGHRIEVKPVEMSDTKEQNTQTHTQAIAKYHYLAAFASSSS